MRFFARHRHTNFIKAFSQDDLDFSHLWRPTMQLGHNRHFDHHRVSAASKLSRNNLEFAGVVVYFFTLAVIFAITIIVMMCRTGAGTDERAANHQVPVAIVSQSEAS